MAKPWGKCPHLSGVRQGRTQQALAPLNLLLIGHPVALRWKPPHLWPMTAKITGRSGLISKLVA